MSYNYQFCICYIPSAWIFRLKGGVEYTPVDLPGSVKIGSDFGVEVGR